MPTLEDLATRFRFQTGSIKSFTSFSVISSPLYLFRFQTGSIKSFTSFSVISSPLYLFRFQTGSIKRYRLLSDEVNRVYFDSKLVRLKGQVLKLGQSERFNFDSKLVRLKGFMKAMHILYAILVRRVKSTFTTVVFKVELLSTPSSAKLLGG